MLKALNKLVTTTKKTLKGTKSQASYSKQQGEERF